MGLVGETGDGEREESQVGTGLTFMLDINLAH